MAKVPYECTLAGEKVEILAKKIIFEDHNLGVKRLSHELQFCSHVGKGNCPVRIDSQNPDIVGSEDFQYPYAGTAQCEYLISLGRHD